MNYIYLKNIIIRYLTLLMSLLIVGSCSVNKKPYYSKEYLNWQQAAPSDSNKLQYTVFLIGDAGAPNPDVQEPTLKLLEGQLKKENEKSAVVFLGDNIYHYGLPKEGAPDRKKSEDRMNGQLDIMKGYRGEKYMIPGNHDWRNGLRGGLEQALRQERYVEKYLEDTTFLTGGNFFVPDDGCPGPFEVKLQDDLVLIAINSQWWLHAHERPYGRNNPCGVENELDFLVQLEDIVTKHEGKHIVIVGHHPLFSNGIHGGNFTLFDHIFPVAIVHKWAKIPLPLIGSIYPLSRKYGGVSQDIAYPKYQALKNGLLEIFEKHDNIIYAAGHEHNIQYFKHKESHHIVSGSGCKTQHVKNGGDAKFTHKAKGFARVNYYENGEVWVEFWEPGESDGSTGEVTFRAILYAKPKVSEEKKLVFEQDFKDSIITVAANPNLEVGWFKRWTLGQHYRKEWATPITIPLLDMKGDFGGLKPFRKGGGKQTATLKLRNPEGQEFSLRSVNKNPTKVLPYALRETLAEDLLRDQVSAQHPYGAVVIPTLASRIGVFHTNPRIVYVPNDPRLRKYIDEFGNMVAIIEEEPDEGHEMVESLGFAKKIIGTDKMLENLREDNDNRIDDIAYLRTRLFDMLIGDWDRHYDQWRWIERKDGKGRFYIPIPEDRDLVFFKGDGFFPYLVSRKWAIRNFQNFGYDYEDVVGLNLSALPLDRALLSRLTKDEWKALALDIKQDLSNEVIENAVKSLPKEIFEVSGQELISKLVSRRDLLPGAAETYYLHLAKVVDVVGTNKHERFEINRVDDRYTDVRVYKITKEGELRNQLYYRRFFTNETKEIRFYGLDGKDHFQISGEVSDGILCRVIGGNDQDVIIDSSSVKGWSKKTFVYDTKEGNIFNFADEVRDKTEEYPEVNNYDRDEYKITYVGPKLSFEYNVDDKFFLGGGVVVRTHRFRKTPYHTEQSFVANFATSTSSYNLRYSGDFRQVLNSWNLGVNATLNGPQFLFNYFGLGNESPQDTNNIDFYRVKFSRFNFAPSLYNDIKSYIRVGLEPYYDQFNVIEGKSGGFINSTEAGLEEGAFRVNRYVGLKAFANVGAANNPVNPRIGINFYNEISYNHQLGHEALSYTRIASELKAYLSLRVPFQVTWAGRLGANHNFGDFRFYQANTLGGTTNLRGYRRTRFAGRSSLYGNLELRAQVFHFNFYLFPAKFGVLGLLDAGRVYVDNENSSKIHTGYGGGIWMDVLKKFVLTGTYARGEKDGFYNVNFGFLF